MIKVRANKIKNKQIENITVNKLKFIWIKLFKGGKIGAKYR